MNELDIVDFQILKLVDYLKELHTKTNKNLQLTTDYAFGYKFYINNKYIIEQMRKDPKKNNKPKHAPHLLLINLAQHFNVDYNFFYNTSYEAEDAIGKTNLNNNTPKKEVIQEVFSEIDARLALFSKEGIEFLSTENKAIRKELEAELSEIKEQLSNSFSVKSLNEKRKHILESFESIIAIQRRKFETIVFNNQLEDKIKKLSESSEESKAEKLRLEKRIQKLTDTIVENNSLLLEAKNAENDALRQLLAIKSK